jgi:hypothetical protein
VISFWIVSVFFFLTAGQILLYRPQTADLFVNLHKTTTQFPILTELADLLPGFSYGGLGGKSLADSFSLNLAGESQGRTVTSILRLGAVAGGFATATNDPCNGAGTKVIETSELGHQIGTLLFQSG